MDSGKARRQPCVIRTNVTQGFRFNSLTYLTMGHGLWVVEMYCIQRLVLLLNENIPVNAVLETLNGLISSFTLEGRVRQAVLVSPLGATCNI